MEHRLKHQSQHGDLRGVGARNGCGLALVRSQQTVDDVDFMEGMIPHHSIAILTSTRAEIEDRRVRKLADEIISAQKSEIKGMSWVLDDIRTNGVAGTS